jgi:Protein of unknown function (DUF1236)
MDLPLAFLVSAGSHSETYLCVLGGDLTRTRQSNQKFGNLIPQPLYECWLRYPALARGRMPGDVELESVPADWGPSLTKYRYVHSGDRVMLVDPGSRTVIHEVD